MLVAATGVGAGDLATAAFSGAQLGVAILWAVLLGAGCKFVLNEGLTRWQLATGQTLLEGAMTRLGRPVQYLFLVYLVIWSFMVAAALMSACGVAAQAIFPFFAEAGTGKIVYGIILSLVGLVLVRLGGFSLFEKVMGVCIGLMFITVLATALMLGPDLGAVLDGMFVPTIPQLDGPGLPWTIALIGGVGGTVTILCYGYWIREEGRQGPEALRICRIDLGVGYAMTALFGLAMVVIGSTIQMEGKGAGLIVQLARKLGQQLGPLGYWAFLLGAFGAIFSSLLGVWQSVPYLFADLWTIMRADDPTKSREIDPNSTPYRLYLYGMALVPMVGLWVGFARMQKTYAIVGALFLPLLSLVLLLLNSRSAWIGEQYRNRPLTVAALVFILVFFVAAGGLTVRRVLGI
ncbi:MAG: iron transporter [Candidatus Latescibacteria bacterium]|nr:iron transporter [Candidatus Latescibacterota bacterium]